MRRPIVTRAGNPNHKLLVPVFDHEQFEPGELVQYFGKPNWKFEPLDAADREEWAKSTAQPSLVNSENLRSRRIERIPSDAEVRSF